MELLLSSLLLSSLCALSSQSVSSSYTPVVTQSPDVSVMEGETVNITCCWTGGFERARVNWRKNLSEIKNNSQEVLQKETSDCTNLTFTNITREDSGRYTCRVVVEVPFYNMSEGKGTVITVTAREKTEDNTNPPKTEDYSMEEVVPYVLRCLPILALVTIFFWLYKSGTKAEQYTAAVPGNELPSAQRIEEDQEEEQSEERETEAGGNEKGDEENHSKNLQTVIN